MAWISSMITVSTETSASRACEVRSRYRDSGVVMRMSGGVREMRARSLAGVSPERMATAGTRYVSPRLSAVAAIPARGARRLRSTSTASAFSGEM
jgi:hypothetical protein